MKRLLIALCVAGLADAVTFSAPAQEPTAWKAGAAAVKITPETPIWMAGYAGRKKPSEGVAADLFAKALAIEDPAGTRLVIVTLDLISVPRTLRDWLEAAVQEKHGLKRSSLLMNCFAHALRSGAARVAAGGRRGQGPARSRRGTLRGRFAAEARRAGRRRRAAAGAGAAGFPAGPRRVCHEPPPPHAARIQQRAVFRRPGGPRGARAPGDRSAGEAGGRAVRLRLPQHDHGRLPDPRRLCRLCAAVPGRRAPRHDGPVHDRLRRRPEPLSARQRGTRQVPRPHAGPGRRGRAADAAQAAARSALPGAGGRDAGLRARSAARGTGEDGGQPARNPMRGTRNGC